MIQNKQLTNCYFCKSRKIYQCQVHDWQWPKSKFSCQKPDQQTEIYNMEEQLQIMFIRDYLKIIWWLEKRDTIGNNKRLQLKLKV